MSLLYSGNKLYFFNLTKSFFPMDPKMNHYLFLSFGFSEFPIHQWSLFPVYLYWLELSLAFVASYHYSDPFIKNQTSVWIPRDSREADTGSKYMECEEGWIALFKTEWDDHMFHVHVIMSLSKIRPIVRPSRTHSTHSAHTRPCFCSANSSRETCMVLFQNVPRNVTAKGQDDTGDCKTMFSDDWMKNYTIAISRARTLATSRNAMGACRGISFLDIPDQCAGSLRVGSMTQSM